MTMIFPPVNIFTCTYSPLIFKVPSNPTALQFYDSLLYFESSWDPFVLYICFMIFTWKQSQQNSATCRTIIYLLVDFSFKI